jgi:hypothetical protein
MKSHKERGEGANWALTPFMACGKVILWLISWSFKSDEGKYTRKGLHKNESH